MLFTWKAKGERSISSMEEVDKLMFILKGKRKIESMYL